MTYSTLCISFSNFGFSIFKIVIKEYHFLFYYRAYERSYRTLSIEASGVLNHHQPHHGGFWFVLSHPHHHSPSPSPPQFAPNRPQQSGREPLPSDEGCGFNERALAPSEARTQPQPPLPFSKGCGRLIFARWEEFGADKHQGAQWECVSREVSHYLPPHPLLLTSSTPLPVRNDTRTLQRRRYTVKPPRHCDDNATTGLDNGERFHNSESDSTTARRV